jgi:hypothetical protein
VLLEPLVLFLPALFQLALQELLVQPVLQEQLALLVLQELEPLAVQQAGILQQKSLTKLLKQIIVCS